MGRSRTTQFKERLKSLRAFNNRKKRTADILSPEDEIEVCKSKILSYKNDFDRGVIHECIFNNKKRFYEERINKFKNMINNQVVNDINISVKGGSI
jgi:hypothetical protein